MNIVWKPLDLMGKRLYRVVANWRGQRSHHIIAADAPRHAAQVYVESVGPVTDLYATGFALQVGQPADWFNQKMISPSACKHHRAETISGMRGSGPGFQEEHHVSICMDCGEITVRTMKDGKRCTVEFGLNCDWHLRAAAKYMRSEAEQTEALARCDAIQMNTRAETPVPLTTDNPPPATDNQQ